MTDDTSFMSKRIGILGGSFNPAHRGHLHISKQALSLMQLDEVWWMVSPQNPLKSAKGMGDLSTRILSAKTIAVDPRIRVTDIEVSFGTTYTAETLKELKKTYPKTHFVWLMGADNLMQIYKWKDWESIFKVFPIAIFTRPRYTNRALAGFAAQRFARYRVHENQARKLSVMRAPAWCFLNIKPDAISATRVRAGIGAIKLY